MIITECEDGQNKNDEGAVNFMVKQKGKRILVSGSGPFYFYSLEKAECWRYPNEMLRKI